jgi:hypothetical protein
MVQYCTVLYSILCDARLKKTAIHMKPQRCLAYPRNPQQKMLSSEVPSIINRIGWWRGHDLCGVVLDGIVVFFEEPGILQW